MYNFQRRGEKISQLTLEINMTGTRQTDVKQRLRNKHKYMSSWRFVPLSEALAKFYSTITCNPGTKGKFHMKKSYIITNLFLGIF